MPAKLKIADLVAVLAAILLVVSSLLDQFGVAGSYDAWHGLVINELIVTYLLGVVVAAVSVAWSLELLPGRLPWAAWTAASALIVLLNSVFAAIALSRLLAALAPDDHIGLGAGPFLGMAAAAILFVAVGLRDVVPGLAASIPNRASTGDAGPPAITPVAGGPYPDVAFGAPSPSEAPPPPEPNPWTPAPPEVAPSQLMQQPNQVQPTQVQPTPPPVGGGTVPVSYTTIGVNPYPAAGPTSAPGPFTPFWAAVPTPRPLYRAEDPSAVLATLLPGTWYAAVAPHPHGLVVQLQSGETGVLVEVADLFRG